MARSVDWHTHCRGCVASFLWVQIIGDSMGTPLPPPLRWGVSTNPQDTRGSHAQFVQTSVGLAHGYGSIELIAFEIDVV